MSLGRAFTLFSNLPTEIRLTIWRAALPLFPRILEAKPDTDDTFNTRVGGARFPRWIIVPTSITTLLSINQESRNELKKFYATPFSPTSILPSSDVASLYINYRFDTLFLDLTRLPYLWPKLYTFNEVVESIFGASFTEAQRELRSLAGTEDLWDLIELQILDSGEVGFESYSNMEEHIVVFEEGILDTDDRLMRFEDVGDVESGEERLYLEQLTRFEGVMVRVCRGVGRKEMGLID
jgi:2EXR family